jgi:hypothetical protein
MPRCESSVSSRTRLIGAERYVIEITEFVLQVFHHELVTHLRRQVSLPTHGAIAVMLGMMMLLAPAVLHIGVAGLVLTATLGAIEIGFSLTFIAPGRYATSGAPISTACSPWQPPRQPWLPPRRATRPPRCFLAVITGLQVCLNLGTRYVERS